MQPVITAKQAREIDARTTSEYGVQSFELMQAAAASCFEAINNHFNGDLRGKRALVLCGRGNNGGDGAALTIQLCGAGVSVDVVLFGRVEETKGDARANFKAVQALATTQAAAADRVINLRFDECTDLATWEGFANSRDNYGFIVDALFGTGLTRPLEGLFKEAVEYLATLRQTRNGADGRRPLIVSVDLPSGLNADLAKPIGPAVEADLTVTFTCPKPANVLPPASHLNGKLIVADIGQVQRLVDETQPNLFVSHAKDAHAWLASTRYTPGSFKNSHGHVLVIAGSRGFTGAAVLCGDAAMRSGAGLVTVAAPGSAQASVAAVMMPEVMTTALAETDRGAISDEAIDHVRKLAARASVVAIGPGLTADDERTRKFVFAVVQQRETPLVIDADGLNCLARYSGKGWPAELEGSTEAPLILTPHAGEMLRLLGTTDQAALEDRVAVVREFAVKHKLILVLKGERSLIAAPDGRVFINPTGNAGLGTAGAGDTLTGLIAGFIAQAHATLKEAFDPLSATIAALYVGGLAGDLAAKKLGMRTMVASDIRDHFSEAICSLDEKGEYP